MAFFFTIQTGSIVPIYRQIVDAVRLGVANGTLAPGEQLPSVRALAEQLVINPNTVARAYGELAREGVLDGQAGKGVFIAKPRAVYTKAERLHRIEPAVESLIHQAIALNLSVQDLRQALEKKLQHMKLTSPPERTSAP
jgi:GntR family transcriptional regulator